jgi:hypothetical protein
MTLIKIFFVKKAYYVKRQDFFEIFLYTVLLMIYHCTYGAETVTCQKSEPEP